LRATLGTLRHVEWQFWVVFFSAFVIMVVMQYNVPFWYGGSDHSDYYWYGRYLLGDSFRGYAVPANWRTPGAGLFHILSGTVLFDTWKGYIAANAVFSVAIPVFFYLMVRPHSRNFALLAGLVTIVSMTPYVYANGAGSDQLYFFLHALLLLLCARYLQIYLHKSPALLAGIITVALCACLVRPVGALIFWIFIAVAAILRPRDWRRLAAASGVYIVLMASWVLWDRAYGTNGGATVGLGYPQLSSMTTSAERRLAEAYFSPQGLIHAASDAAAVGYPDSQTLRTTLSEFLEKHQNDWERPSLFTPPSLFAHYAKDPNPSESLLNALFTDRNYLYFSFIVSTVTEALGKDDALSLLYGVSREHGTTGLYGFAGNFLKHPTQLLFGVTPNMGGRNLFAVLYMAGYRERVMHIASTEDIPDPLLSPDLGPANAFLLKTLRRFIDDYPQYWPKTIAAPYRGDPEGFYKLMLRGGATNDAVDLEGYFYQVVNWYLSPTLAASVYVPAALEILERYPKLAVLYYENFLYFTVLRRIGPVDAALDRAALDHMSDSYIERQVQVSDDLPRGLAKELTPVVEAGEIRKDSVALQMIIYFIAPSFIFLMIVALPFLRGRIAIGVCMFLLIDYVFEVVPIALFSAWGTPRYEANFYLLPLYISCIIFGQATKGLRNRNRSQDLDAQPSAPRVAG
jgi:hypothetical protein